MNTPLPTAEFSLEGEWTIARAAELKARLDGLAPGGVLVNAGALERIDLACLQCLWAAGAAGRITALEDPRHVLRSEVNRLGLQNLFKLLLPLSP